MLPENPDMLASYLNLKLRDEYSSLDSLCEDMDVSKSELIDKLKSAGYRYDDNNNAFR